MISSQLSALHDYRRPTRTARDPVVPGPGLELSKRHRDFDGRRGTGAERFPGVSSLRIFMRIARLEPIPMMARALVSDLEFEPLLQSSGVRHRVERSLTDSPVFEYA